MVPEVAGNPPATEPASPPMEVQQPPIEPTGGQGTPLPPSSKDMPTRNTWLEENPDKTSTLIVPKTREECISFLNAVNANGTEECHLANENIAANQKFPIICEMFKILFETQTDVMGAVATNTQTSELNANTASSTAAAMQEMESEVNKLEEAKVPLPSDSVVSEAPTTTGDGEGKTEDGEVPLLVDDSAGDTEPSKPDETQNENGNGKPDIGGDATVNGEIQDEAIPGSTAQPVKPDKNGNCDCDDEIEKYVNNQFGGGNVQEKLEKFKRLTEAGKHPTDYQDLNKVDVGLAEKSKYHVSFL